MPMQSERIDWNKIMHPMYRKVLLKGLTCKRLADGTCTHEFCTESCEDYIGENVND